MTLTAQTLRELYDNLLATYGPQHWWPARERFEILVGAVLVQRTTWTSAAAALQRLRDDNALTAEGILAHTALADAIRVAGPHHVKAQRLRNLCRWFVQAGGFEGLEEQSTDTLRRALLAVHGIGPETADVIVLYALKRPVFVADAYAFRVLGRYGWLSERTSYARLRSRIEAIGPGDAAFYNELHALIVAHGKQVCHKQSPNCATCVLAPCCAKQGL